MKPFDTWFFSQKDERILLNGKPVPMATTLLYEFCNDDSGKFNRLCELLGMAFDAGGGTNARPAPALTAEITGIQYLAGEIKLRMPDDGEVPQWLESGKRVTLLVVQEGGATA